MRPKVIPNLSVLRPRITPLLGVSFLLLAALVISPITGVDAVAPAVTVTIDCGDGGAPTYTSAGFTIPSRSIIPGSGNNGFTNREYVSITTDEVLSITISNCISSFSTSYGGQEAHDFTEDCGTFSPTPITGDVTGLTMSYTYTPLTTPANSRTRAYCDGTGGTGSGDHIQYWSDLSPQLTIFVSEAVLSTTTTSTGPQSGASGVTGVVVDGSSLLKVSKSATARSIAKFAKFKVPATSKVSLKVVPSSSKVCKVVGASLKGLKAGSCKVTVTVKPRTGKSTSKTIALKVAK